MSQNNPEQERISINELTPEEEKIVEEAHARGENGFIPTEDLPTYESMLEALADLRKRFKETGDRSLLQYIIQFEDGYING